MQKLFRSSISRSPQTKSTYASTMPRCPSSARSAEILLLCTLAMGMEFFFAAFTAPCTILWDTVRVNRIIILAAHTLVSSDNHNAHWIISPHKVPGLLRHTPQPVDISGSQADPRHQELCVSRLVSHVPHSWGSLLLQELALTNYRIAYI